MSEKRLEKVGQVTLEERDQIQTLFNRKNALNELVMILKNSTQNGEVDDLLYEKVIKDIGETGAKFQNWWDMMGEKYQWKSHSQGSWRINFQTCEIFLEY